MDVARELNLASFATASEVAELTLWLQEADLNNVGFLKRLRRWFDNFPSTDDKKLALLLLRNFKFYSEASYRLHLKELLTELTAALISAGVAEDRVVIVVDDDYRDSSVLIPYLASKEHNLLNDAQVVPVSRLAGVDKTADAFVVLNDTQGSGNQFSSRIWPSLSSKISDRGYVWVVCFELAELARKAIKDLDPRIHLIPETATQYSLDALTSQNYLTLNQRSRVEELCKIANPSMPLGYGGCGLLVSYYYQCPNNSLAIFWGVGGSGNQAKWNTLFEYRSKQRSGKRRQLEQEVSADAVKSRASSKSIDVDVRSIIRDREWIPGAVNFDEDLHFSAFYLRASCKQFMPDQLREYGYTSIIASYRDFNETYFIPRDECVAVAERLLARVQSDPNWLEQTLDEIGKRASELSNVFDLPPRDDVFDALSDDRLLTLYKSHNVTHARLYEVARIPEALDRGFGTFTNYLRSTLGGYIQGGVADQKTVNAYFNILTFPERASLAHQELVEFRAIVQDVRRADQGGIFSGASKRALLRLSPTLRARISRHRDKWSYWGYHGYGSRALPDVEEYLQRIASELSGHEYGTPQNYQETIEKAEGARVRLARRLGISEDIEQLYRLHSRIGLAKLLRRFHQLRNFYFLDRLLLSASARLGESEAVIRSLLPWELEAVLSGKMSVSLEHRRRTDRCVYIIHDGTERVFSEDSQCLMVEALLKRGPSLQNPLDTHVLRGQPASAGVARGQCRVVIRKGDADRVGFKTGDILVSESTDMDLYEWIQRAGGVVTEAGGATCHAAIVCRELGKPAIVGVEDAINRLRNGDLVVLDADQGTITIQTKFDRKFTLDPAAAFEKGSAELGAKAWTLARLTRANARVPTFFCLPWSVIAKALTGATPDSDGLARQELASEIQAALGSLSGQMFVLRSSMANEDGRSASQAGLWPSEIGVLRQDVVGSAFGFIERMVRSGGVPISGSLIVQEMILGDASGVCFTRDPRQENSNSMLLELIPGGNELLTEGRLTPVQFSIARDTRLVTLTGRGAHWSKYVSETQIRLIADVCLEIEAIIGAVQDIEWTIEQGKVFVLQSRPNTAGMRVSQIETAQRPSIPEVARNHVSAIYRAYRVPPNLQRHLLRVSALGKLICENWAGPPVNVARVVAALLLHDIGNIVKADYDRFPELFPEEMKNLGYWKAVQESTRTRFGDDDLTASMAISREIGVSEDILSLIERKQFVNNLATAAGSDYEVKIAAYADQRVGPHGVLSIEERLSEARRRYKGHPNASVNRNDFADLVKAAYSIETQIDSYSTIALGDINDEALQVSIEALKEFDVLRMQI